MNENRNRLIDIAQKSVQQTGLKALSFRTLADEAGIKSSSVHYYFPEKSDLARVLIERYRDTLLNALDGITSREESLKLQFAEFVLIFEDVARNNRICLCSMMAAEFELLRKDNQMLLKSVFADMEQWLTRLFDSRRDQLATELPSSTLARVTLTGLEGALLIDRVMGDTQRVGAQREAILTLMR